MTRCAPLHRSPGLQPGTFRQLGVMHLHIDGAGYQDLVNSLVSELEVCGAKVKLTAVTQAVIGPQRIQQPETYASHTPGMSVEKLEYFSTSTLHNRSDAITTIAKTIPRISTHDGVVIEVERVIGKLDEIGWQSVPVKDQPILGVEVGYGRSPTLAYEIHHAIDLVSDSLVTNQPALDLQELLRDTTNRGLNVGGWFSFFKSTGQLSFRSNAFTDEEDIERQVHFEYNLIRESELLHGIQFRQWTIVEQVLGIWRSPFESLRREAI